MQNKKIEATEKSKIAQNSFSHNFSKVGTKIQILAPGSFLILVRLLLGSASPSSDLNSEMQAQHFFDFGAFF